MHILFNNANDLLIHHLHRCRNQSRRDHRRDRDPRLFNRVEDR